VEEWASKRVEIKINSPFCKIVLVLDLQNPFLIQCGGMPI
jgi:hypothetical protein